jgi:hypothetical protein
MLRFALSPLTSISLIGADPVFKDRNQKRNNARSIGKKKEKEQKWILVMEIWMTLKLVIYIILNFRQ